MEKIENDFTNAKYKQGTWVTFKHDGRTIRGLVKYYHKGDYFVLVFLRNGGETFYQIKEEDIMSEPEAKYGNKTGIGEGKPKYNVGDKVICYPHGVKAIRKTGVIIANHKEKDKYFYDIVELDSPMMWKKCPEEDVSLIPIYPSPSLQFKEITELMYDTYKKKNADYGDSFSKSVEKYGLISALTRMSDKFNRIENLILNGKSEVKDESLMDSLLDLANYAVMTYIEVNIQKICNE